MPFADTSLRDEYAAAVERVAGRVLDALRGAAGPASPGRPGDGTPDGPPNSPSPDVPLLESPLSRAELAAVRVLGPDVFAPRLLHGLLPDRPTALAVALALEAFPAPAPGTTDDPSDGAAAASWRDRATLDLLALGGHSGGHPDGQPVSAPRPAARPGPPPAPVPEPALLGWPRWSVAMARLSPLALPDLGGPIHDLARRHALALARGAARSMMRRDLRTAARIARWLAWTVANGAPEHLEVAPVLDRVRAAGDGSARIALEVAIAEGLLALRPNGAAV
ncbi:hypothetical protein [Kitasatospora sp. A2-31]|uniref:hypothetical protein n=1 Tax=Kitasatospora sp. A2-31 TaxID=2916414 RepID=UPI001EE9B424|nr:hypothetical protein [Kitasatospora sp. A2-31]MCG6495995.1 hypothetical protein [Kitasatospora sp. A2-31]